MKELDLDSYDNKQLSFNMQDWELNEEFHETVVFWMLIHIMFEKNYRNGIQNPFILVYKKKIGYIDTEKFELSINQAHPSLGEHLTKFSIPLPKCFNLTLLNHFLKSFPY